MNDTNEVPLSIFYLKFKDHGVLHEIIPGTIAYMILVLVGLYGNITIAVITYRYKQFHGTCGVMLVLGALGDSVHQLSHFFFWYLILSGELFTELRTCVIVNTVPIIGLNMGVFMTLFVAIDRLFSVLFPGKHRVLNKTLYMAALIGIIIGFDIFCFLQIYYNMSLIPTFMTTCLIIDAMPGGIGQTWFTICIILHVSTVVCYVIVWIALKFKTSTSDSTRRIFKSLAILGGTVFFGWAINAVIQVVLRAFEVDPIEGWFIGFHAGLPVNTACASNYFVLYYFSKDYRIAFRKQMNAISTVLFGKSIVKIEGDVTIQPITITNTHTFSKK